MDTQYRVVYSGRLSLGHSHHEVVMNSRGRVIKPDLSLAQAERYREALAAVGLVVVSVLTIAVYTTYRDIFQS